jgi:uncharacterized protein YndB with AHSA1/START domain
MLVSEQRNDDVIRYTEIVDVSPDVAFSAYVDHFSSWWPSVYTFAGGTLEWIGIEPQESGRCIERAQDGTETIWGIVLVYEPPDRIVTSWRIQPDRTISDDPDLASEIELRFIDERALTRIEFEHRNIARHGEGWQEMRDALAAREGWPFLMQCFSDFANRPG